MSNPSTLKYINLLSNLKNGELSLLRTMRNKPLDETLDGFDLFTSIWWPLREESSRAPQRETAWLIAKLFAAYPIRQEDGAKMSYLLGSLYRSHRNDVLGNQILKLNDKIVAQPLAMLEPDLGMALSMIRKKKSSIDWADLTDTLSIWGYQWVRERWVEEFLTNNTIDRSE